jgi:uncharacterized protein (DUF433 family)
MVGWLSSSWSIAEVPSSLFHLLTGCPPVVVPAEDLLAHAHPVADDLRRDIVEQVRGDRPRPTTGRTDPSDAPLSLFRVLVRGVAGPAGRGLTYGDTGDWCMAVTKSKIVSGEDSEIHDEPHIEGSRVTVQHIHARVEERGLRPETVAERLNLDVADVYEALAYYHRHPEEMREIEERRARVAEEAETLEKPE